MGHFLLGAISVTGSSYNLNLITLKSNAYKKYECNKIGISLLNKVVKHRGWLSLLACSVVVGCSYKPMAFPVGNSRDHSRYHFSVLEPRTAYTRSVSFWNAPWSKKGPKVKRCCCMFSSVLAVTGLSGGIGWLLYQNNSEAVSPGAANTSLTSVDPFNANLSGTTASMGLDNATIERIVSATESLKNMTFSSENMEDSEEDKVVSFNSSTVASNDSYSLPDEETTTAATEPID